MSTTIRMGQLRSKEVPVPVEFEGDTFTLRYCPHKMTPALMDDVTARSDAVETNHEVYTIFRQELPQIVVGWNVVDERDQPVPFTTEALNGMADALAGAMWRALVDHQRPNPVSAGS